MEIDSAISEKIYETIINSKNILIISHRNPDPDCLGSNLALRHVFKRPGVNITSACVDPIPDNYMFFTELNKFVNDIEPEIFDLVISLDCGSPNQAGFPLKYPEMTDMKTPWINIDHHPSNSGYGTLNLVDDEAAATVLILHALFQQWGITITPYLASCLLFGLYFDTGSFMHSSTNAGVLKAAADLLAKGANHKLIVQKLFKNCSVEQLKIWGKALSNVRVTENNVIVTGIMENDFRDCNATCSDLSGIIDYLSSVKGVKFATILSHDSDGNVRVSLRTRRDDVNVSEIAGTFGGGGHKKASGFTLKGRLRKKTYWSITND